MQAPLTAELVYWITERYSIKLRRDEGMKKPWTADKIFQRVRFCNVHREDDKVTQFIRQNWNRADDPVWRFVLARLINWPESLAFIATMRTPSECVIELKRWRGMGEKVFTSAYTVSTNGQSVDKLDYVMWMLHTVLDKEVAGGWPLYLLCENTWRDIQAIPGLGSFLSAQIVADMKNTKNHPLEKSEDWWTFSAPGPGSLRGLSWYFNHTDLGVAASQYHEKLAECRKEVDPLIPKYIPRISNQDFQNCLCEFSKYMKVKCNPNAHVRNHYQGV